MTTYTWPSSGTKPYWPARVAWGQMHNTRAFTSPLSGYVQTAGIPGSRWRLTLDFPKQSYAERRELEAWLSQLSGQEHRASMFDPAQPLPRGTCNTSGVTCSGGASQFATSITLAGCGASKTLLAGDLIGVTTSGGGQLLKVTADATANGSGVMTVSFRHPLRAAVAGASAVVLDRPRVLCILADPHLEVPYASAGSCPPFSVAFVETYA